MLFNTTSNRTAQNEWKSKKKLNRIEEQMRIEQKIKLKRKEQNKTEHYNRTK